MARPALEAVCSPDLQKAADILGNDVSFPKLQRDLVTFEAVHYSSDNKWAPMPGVTPAGGGLGNFWASCCDGGSLCGMVFMKIWKLILFDYGQLSSNGPPGLQNAKEGLKKWRSSKYNLGLLCRCVSLPRPQRATRCLSLIFMSVSLIYIPMKIRS